MVNADVFAPAGREPASPQAVEGAIAQEHSPPSTFVERGMVTAMPDAPWVGPARTRTGVFPTIRDQQHSGRETASPQAVEGAIAEEHSPLSTFVERGTVTAMPGSPRVRPAGTRKGRSPCTGVFPTIRDQQRAGREPASPQAVEGAIAEEHSPLSTDAERGTVTAMPGSPRVRPAGTRTGVFPTIRDQQHSGRVAGTLAPRDRSGVPVMTWPGISDDGSNP